MAGNEKILKLKQVIEIVGISRSSIYSLVQRGAFPKPIKISIRSSGWLLSEVERWIESRASSRIS